MEAESDRPDDTSTVAMAVVDPLQAEIINTTTEISVNATNTFVIARSHKRYCPRSTGGPMPSKTSLG